METIEVRLIRHASGSHMLNPDLIAGRSLDAQLTSEGVQEAKQRGFELAAAGFMPDIVVSSPAERCIQTGKHILSAMGMRRDINIEDNLVEMDQGDYVGQVRSEVYDESVQRQIASLGKDFALPGGESMNQVGLRGHNWLESLETLSNGKVSNVLAVTHLGLITHTVGNIKGWNHATSLEMLKTVSPVSETVLIFDGTEWRLEAFARPLNH